MVQKRKWIIVAAVAAAVVLVFSAIGGLVYAQGPGNAPSPAPRVNQEKVLLAKVATILGIDNTTLEKAFTQAQADMQKERQAEQVKQRNERIDQMVTDGKITAEEAAKYKAWLDSKPEVKMPGMDMFGGPGGGPPGDQGGRGGPGGGPPGGPGGGHRGGPGGPPPDWQGNAPAPAAAS